MRTLNQELAQVAKDRAAIKAMTGISEENRKKSPADLQRDEDELREKLAAADVIAARLLADAEAGLV